jgi:ribonuclease D
MAYPISLSRLVNELMGVHLGKGLTFTHWDQRPLSAVQLRYAADDVRYLPAIRAELGARLEALGHAAWAREECEAMCDARQYGFNPDVQYLRVRGAHSLEPKNLAVLRELTIWRDAAARAHDLPPRAFLRDEVLADLARSPVKSVEKLSRVRGLPRPVEHEYGTQIVEATLKALAMPAQERPQPRSSEETPTDRFRADALWAVAQSLCAGRSIDPALVSNRHEMGEWYRTLASGGDVSGLRPMRGWRGQALGQTLLELIGGKACVEIDWNEGPHAEARAK